MKRARLVGAVMLAMFAVAAAPKVCFAQGESDLAMDSQLVNVQPLIALTITKH